MDQSEHLIGTGQGRTAHVIEPPTNPILARMRFLSRLLDNSIQLPGGYRIGIDPIIGLIPTVGDVIASALSMWLVWDGLRLGLPKRVIGLMMGNVLIEAMIGAVPLIGDLIDAVWKANARNMRLVELNYSPALKQRSVPSIALFFAVCVLLVLTVLATVIYWVFKLLATLF